MAGASEEERNERLIRRLLERFSGDPGDRTAFATLEEHLYLRGAWQQLATVYQRRLAALDESGREWRDLVLRLGRLIDDRLERPEAAKRCYLALLHKHPRHAEAAACLRRAQVSTGDTSAALQIAELEETLLEGGRGDAVSLAEIGSLWCQVGELEEGERRLSRALDCDPSCEPALAELAAIAEARGDREQALVLLERKLALLEGAARLDAMQELSEWLPDDDPRLREWLHEVVRELPNQQTPIRRLAELERKDGSFLRAEALYEQLFELQRSGSTRGQLAAKVARILLDEAHDEERALRWLERVAAELPDNPSTHRLRARLYRRLGRPASLIDALEALERIEGPTSMRQLEIAVLHEREGQPERAIESLRGLLQREPGDAEALEILDRCLTRLGRHGERAEVLEARLQLAQGPESWSDLAVAAGQLHLTHFEDPRIAEQLFRGALARVPGHSGASEHLKQLLSKEQRWPELASLLEESADRAPAGARAAELWCELARVRRKLSAESEPVRDAYLRALGSDPALMAALEGLRSLAAETGDEVALIEACERELDLEPPPARAAELLAELVETAHGTGDLARAQLAAERWTDLDPTAAGYRKLAEIAHEQGDAACEANALECLEGLVREDPEERSAIFQRLAELAMARPEPNALENAAHWYRQSLAFRPDTEVRRRLIEIYRRTGQLPELAFEIRAALESARGEEAVSLRVQLARTLAELGDLEGAAEALHPAFQANPRETQIADLLEGFLADLRRLDALAEMLSQRLRHEREPGRRREIAYRLGGVLLDELDRPDPAVASLRELADPSRHAPLEQLFERALESSESRREHETWLVMRESHVDRAERVNLLLRLAELQQEADRGPEAVATLCRAEGVASDQAERVRKPLLRLLRQCGDQEQELELLGRLIADAAEPSALVRYRLDRATLLIDRLQRPGEGRIDLDALELGALSAADLQRVLGLYERAGSTRGQARALEALAALVSDPEERRPLLRRLGALLGEGPEAVRDPARAETVFEELLDLEPAEDFAFTRLARLLRASGQWQKEAALLRRRLELSGLERSERARLSFELGELLSRNGDTEAAIDALQRAREEGATSDASDEMLYRLLELRSDTERCRALCAEQAQLRGPERARWLRRWLASLEKLGASAEERLDVLEALLAEAPGDYEIAALRLPLLRSLRREGALADALGQILVEGPELPTGRRRSWVRELLRLCEGPLADPVRALRVLERELPSDPALHRRGVRLATRLGDDERLVALLKPRVREGGDLSPGTEPGDLRRLCLALARLRRDREAEPLLWRAVELEPRDREAVVALAEILRSREATRELLQVLELQFPLEAGPQRAGIASEGVALAEADGDAETALRWIRRWHGLEPMPRPQLDRWLELERSAGDRRGVLQVLQALRDDCDDDAELGPLLADEAALHARSKQLELGREKYEQALRHSARPPAAWLAALDAILAGQGRTTRRSGVLRDLTRHPDLTERERQRYREMRVEVLAGQPELREEAAAELVKLIESDADAPRALRVQRMRRLLSLYAELHRPLAWCELAEKLAEQLEGRERMELLRALARRLTTNGLDLARAVPAWEQILARAPEDREALRALIRLYDRRSGCARRAELLERLALLQGDAQAGPLWLEAAELRWRHLRDAQRGLACVERALATGADAVAAHGLRWELCKQAEDREGESRSLRFLLEREEPRGEAWKRWLRLAELLASEEASRGEAREAAERALANAPDLREVRPHVRSLFIQVRAFERACDLLRSELESAQGMARLAALRELARIEWEERRQAEPAAQALAALEREAVLNAGDCERWYEALAALGRWPEALQKRRAALSARGDGASAEEWLELAQLAVLHRADPELARVACDRTLARVPGTMEALELRAELHASSGAFADQLEDWVEIAERTEPAVAAAEVFTRAGALAQEKLGDEARAWALYRQALKRDGTHLAALLGAGEIAFARSEWSEAERMFGKACTTAHAQTASFDEAAAARKAAEAALQQHRDTEAFRYLEQALEAEPQDPDALDAMGQLALRLNAPGRARVCLEERLARDDLRPDERAERLVRLAQACEALEDSRAACAALLRVISLRPADEVSRARVVDLLEQLGEVERAIAELDAWAQHAPESERPALLLRAARLASQLGRREETRERLEQLLHDGTGPADAWCELATLTLEERGASAAAEIIERALPQVTEREPRGTLLWLDARVSNEIGRTNDAARRARETLELVPSQVDAAQLLAQNLGRVDDFAAAVRLLERSLDTARPAKPAEAEIWEAIGRAYAGPLEDMERAERCYRRALEANPRRASAREALADITAFDPAAHAESVNLHRELLASFPARPGSWNSLAHVAQHWGRERAQTTCQLVLEALRVAGRSDVSAPAQRPLLHSGSSEEPAVRAATELLRALNEANLLPDVSSTAAAAPELPLEIRMHLADLAGPGWELADSQLAEIWRRRGHEHLLSAERVSRKTRRQLQRALRELDTAALHELEPAHWRAELLAQAAATAVDQGTLPLGDALQALLSAWPATSHLDLGSDGDLPAAIQLCPPAQALLLRVADTTLGALGL